MIFSDEVFDDMYYRVPVENSLVMREIKTYSKLEAISYSKDSTKNEFVYNEKGFDAIDCTVEPTESLNELYRKRAEQLRHDYDHIVVMYSGGIDSTNALHSFLNNNIQVDEICTWLFTDIQTDKTNISNKEAVKKALPYAQYLVDTGKVKKATTVEIGQFIIDQFKNATISENFTWILNGVANPWILAVRSSPLFKERFFPHHRDLLKQGKKICFVWGFDKCEFNYNQEVNQYQMYFSDSAFDLHSQKLMYRKIMNRDTSYISVDEPFYYSILHPKITIKQCHMVKKFLELVPENSSVLIARDNVPTTGPFVMHRNGRFLHKKTIDRIIYPNEDVSLFGDDKVKLSMIISPKIEWFFKYKDHEGKNIFLDRVKYIMQKYPHFYNYKKGMPWTTQVFTSKKYNLGTHIDIALS